ncbi:MAG: NADH-quinone oxidoreductase subunit M [Thermoplasmatales archaeon]|nr:NADH-quinone oxidoreductase subunit M [Thermoplasmatales archaeon]
MLSEIPLLSLLLIVPLIGAVVTLLMGGGMAKHAGKAAGLFAAITMVLSLYLLFVDDLSTLDESHVWIDAVGLKINYALTVDGLSLLLILMTTILVTLVLVFCKNEADRPNYFHSLILMMEIGLVGVFMAADYFLFYVMWEVTLIPMFFLISWYGGPRRHYAAIKFFIYTHVASLVMLIGIFAMVFEASSVTGAGIDFAFEAVKAAPFAKDFQTVVFGLLFFGFIVKMPMVPFHTWLPDAHVEAPTGGSVLLAASMLKMGSYGIVRICLEALPLGAIEWQWVMIGLGLVSMVYGAYACIAQKDLKKLVAYSSVSHMGMVLLAIGTLSEIGILFAVVQMFAHGLISAALFMVAGAAGHNFGTRDIPLLGGLAGKFPLFAAFMMFSFMASLGLPGLVGFVAEFGILFSFWEFLAAQPDEWVTVLIAFGPLYMLLTAGYYLWAMQRTLFGAETKKVDLSKCEDLGGPETVALGLVCLLVAVFGIMPSLAVDFIAPYADTLGTFLGGLI